MKIFAVAVFLLGEAVKLCAQNEEYASTQIDRVTLRSSTRTSITASWLRPKGTFNHYRVNITENKVGSNGHVEHQSLAACAFPNSVGHHEMPAACGGVVPCRNINLEVLTYSLGPPERITLVVRMEGIFVLGHEPDPPSNITMVEVSPSITRIEWQPPAKLSGSIGPYTVKVCDGYLSCDGDQGLRSCRVSQTNQTWLEIENSAVTQYCVVVMASARCGTHILRSLPATAEIVTPYYVVPAPDVTNFTLAAVGKDFFTVTWEPASASIDTYWVDIVDISGRSNAEDTQGYGTCAGHMEVQPRQTELTCSQLKPCSNFTITVGTRINGPLYVPSIGVKLAGIFIAEEVLPEVTNLKLGIGQDYFVLTWQRPKACFDYYTVEIIDENTGHNSGVSCNEGAVINAHETSVICDQTRTCTNVKIQVRTHTRGPPRRSSTGFELSHVLLRGTVPPEVANLTLQYRGAIGFDFTFEAPKKCFDMLGYNITYSTSGNREVTHYGCTFFPDSSGGLCTVRACGLVDFAMWTHVLGPPIRDSRKVFLREIPFADTCRG